MPPSALYAAVGAVAVVVVIAFSLTTRDLAPPEEAPDTTTAAATGESLDSAPPDSAPASVVATGPLQPVSVAASSELSERYGAQNLIDDDPESVWNDASLHGEGAVLTFEFGMDVQVDEIVITNLADEERFVRNFRLREYSIEFDGGGSPIEGELSDVQESQTIAVGGRRTSSLRLSVVSTYPAAGYAGSPPFEELAIAEIAFLGG